MSVLDKLATSLNRRDEVPNQILAKQIVAKNDKKAVLELVTNLHNKNKNIQADCIKTLYEIGEIKAELIAGYAKEFLVLLESKNNRMQWGAMHALKVITDVNPESVYSVLGKIISAAEKGSVITKDHYVNILIKLSKEKKYSKHTFPLLLEHLKGSLTNQLPKYAEDSLPLIDANNKEVFLKALTSRLKDMDVETKKTRLEKVIKKVNGIK